MAETHRGSAPGATHHAGITESERNIQELVDRILALPLAAQLGIVRTVAPRALARLDGNEQSSFLRDLLNEWNKALQGQAVYDVRPEPH